MRTVMKIVLGIAIVLVVIGILGNVFFNDYLMAGNINRSFSSGSMMYYSGNPTGLDSRKVLDLEILENNLKAYIGQFGENLEISDVFIFEDSEYYFSITEENTGLGAMELLVNQYTGDVFPEFGPNMMWNLKYGMHTGTGHGMMGGVNPWIAYNSENLSFSKNTISLDSAQKAAMEYIEDRVAKAYTVSKEGHEFYGYYTFYIENEQETIGASLKNHEDVWNDIESHTK